MRGGGEDGGNPRVQGREEMMKKKQRNNRKLEGVLMMKPTLKSGCVSGSVSSVHVEINFLCAQIHNLLHNNYSIKNKLHHKRLTTFELYNPKVKY